MRIAGSLWSVPVDQQSTRLQTATEAGLAAVHWDATDGTFAAHGGFTPATASRLLAECPSIDSEAHLMLQDPRPEIPDWVAFCSLVAVPIEIEYAVEATALVEKLGGQPALAVSLRTRLRSVPADYPILLMAIAPGQAGSPFDPAVLHRVSELRDRARNPLLGVDGGVGPSEFTALSYAGANWIVSGTSLFASADPADWLSLCKSAFSRDSRS